MDSVISQVPHSQHAAHTEAVADDFLQFADHSIDCAYFALCRAEFTATVKGANPIRPLMSFERLAKAENDAF